jgi:hypothetical protein
MDHRHFALYGDGVAFTDPRAMVRTDRRLTEHEDAPPRQGSETRSWGAEKPNSHFLDGARAALKHQDDEKRELLLVTLIVDVVRETVSLKRPLQDRQLFRTGDCSFSKEHPAPSLGTEKKQDQASLGRTTAQHNPLKATRQANRRLR